MITYISRIRNTESLTIKYHIIDKSGQTVTLHPDRLKTVMKDGLQVNNLTLTSDNRLIVSDNNNKPTDCIVERNSSAIKRFVDTLSKCIQKQQTNYPRKDKSVIRYHN